MNKNQKHFDDMTEAEVLEEIQQAIDGFPGDVDLNWYYGPEP